MSTRMQAALSAALVLAAVVTVAAFRLVDRKAPAAMPAGHSHGAAAPAPAGPQAVGLTAEGARRIGVSYAQARLATLRRTVRVVGTVAYDETRLADVDPKIEGWVDRLYVDFTGQPVRKGQPLMAVYSPMLVSAQEELLLARRLADEQGADPRSPAARNARELLEAARRRLAYWDIDADQIARIENSGRTTRTVVLRAPASGVVVEKNVVEGARIMPGMDLYRIADLSTVWVEGDVYEKDLSLVSVGQQARVTLQSYPGRELEGVVTYVYPTVSPESRTGRVRVALANPGGLLKPGMYASLELAAPATRELVVPRSAVLATGERTLVFVRQTDGMLQPREIRTGLVDDSLAQIRSGLAAGDVVVSSAGFLVDAEANLGSAMASMPGMDLGAPGGGDTGGEPMPGMAMPATPPAPGAPAHPGH
jgi:Cu(I)/Ag(I) efflux system membrane fusion protein